MSRKTDRVTILNPLGSLNIVSADAAIAMIVQGRAVPSPNVPNAILIITKSADGSTESVPRDSKSGYDRCAHRGLATMKSMQHVPVMLPLHLFTLPTRKTVKQLHANSGALGTGVDECDTTKITGARR